MALWFDLMVNTENVGRVEIQRIETRPGGRHLYRWVITRPGDAEYRGSVEHDEHDGALALVFIALDVYLDAVGAGG